MNNETGGGRDSDRGSIPVDSFGNRLKLARAHAGHLSIREAADLCHIGRGAWTNWERGARPADIIDVSAVVACRLGVDRDWLLFGGPLATSEPRSLLRRRTIDCAITEPARPGLRRDSVRPVSTPPPTRH